MVGLLEQSKANSMKNIWILVHIYRGIIQTPEIFVNEHSAKRRKKEILKFFNRDYDEIEIFKMKSV